MISPNDIRIKAERKYLGYLQSKVQELSYKRLIIPGDKSYSKSLSEFEVEILALVNNSKERKGYGFSIDYQTVKTKKIETQSLPTSIYFDTEKDFLRYLGKEKEVENFEFNWRLIVSQFPELKDWIIQNPFKIIQNQSKWNNILKVCQYFKNNPQPKLFLRELPINVHTKFIETNQSIVSELLEVIINPFINHHEKEFAKRFNLNFREPLIRFKILDKNISRDFFSGLDDISIPVSQFESLILPLKRVLIVENKTTLFTTLTLPKMHETIAIFGSGYSVYNLKNAHWLEQIELLYWGDIDAQGFEILSQVRSYFPNTISVLMDQVTFDKYFENDIGTPSTIASELHLTVNEKRLYDILRNNNWRLEQEKISFEYVNKFFENT